MKQILIKLFMDKAFMCNYEKLTVEVYKCIELCFKIVNIMEKNLVEERDSIKTCNFSQIIGINCL